MRIPVLMISTSLALAACSSTGGGKLAVCDGKHLRPGNPYGTVLAPAAAEVRSSAPPGAADSKPKTLSSVGSAVSFGSCRA